MQHTFKILVAAEDDANDAMFNSSLEVVIDGATGMVRNPDDPPLLEKEKVTISLAGTVERDYLVDTIDDWVLKVNEDNPNLPGSMAEIEYDFKDTTKVAKDVLPDIEKRFNKSENPKERRFLKKFELLTRAFLTMVDGKEKLEALLGDVDIAVTVELMSTYEEPIVAPSPCPSLDMQPPVKKKRVRKTK